MTEADVFLRKIMRGENGYKTIHNKIECNILKVTIDNVSKIAIVLE